jgi:hypothetical protein
LRAQTQPHGTGSSRKLRRQQLVSPPGHTYGGDTGRARVPNPRHALLYVADEADKKGTLYVGIASKIDGTVYAAGRGSPAVVDVPAGFVAAFASHHGPAH